VSMRRLCTPRPVEVAVDARNLPSAIRNLPVEATAEDWVIEDRWWTGRPLRRRYFELVLEGGACMVVFRDLERDRWFSQSG
jgi:hypothetical protein